jgi:two-component sensor histidine kinase
MGIALALYKNNTQKQRANQVLRQKNEEVGEMVTQLKSAQVSLAAKNAENELLLKEIHHRVKNNLEVISSLLALQSAHIHAPELQAALLASQNRVQSMGILHQKLYQNEQLAIIEMRQYFQHLAANLLDAYNATGQVAVYYLMPELALDADTAVPVGLIVNELVTNSLKYAFPDGQPGRIEVSLVAKGAGRLHLTVADNGVGKAATVVEPGLGFGTQLVALLTRQLDGTLQQDTAQGTRVTIEFARQRT